MTVPEGADYTVLGDVEVGGTSTNYIGILDNMGTLTVTGDINVYADTSSSYYRIRLSSDDALLRLYGDQNFGLDTHRGTVEFCGSSQQKAMGNYRNITVTNPEGITGDIILHGYFNANSTPFEGSVSLNNGATLSEGTNFGSVSISGNYTLGTDITADTVTVLSSSTMTVASDTAYTIDADLILYGYSSGGTAYRSKVYVNGNLTLTGDLLYHEKASSSYCEFTTYVGSVLRLSGKGLQVINCMSGNAYTIILENRSDEGVVFKKNLYIKTLFDHRRNNYSMTAGSTFVDYDGDGIKDNEDPIPTVITGDIFIDDSINGRDANLLSRVISGNPDPSMTDESYIAADVNGDGQTNGKDANILAKMISGSV